MERRAFRIPGFLVLLLSIALEAVLIVYAVRQADLSTDVAGPRLAVAGVGMVLVLLLAFTGFTVINPNEARVIQFFGRYVGAITRAGFHWTVPFSAKRRVSMRVRNFE